MSKFPLRTDAQPRDSHARWLSVAAILASVGYLGWRLTVVTQHAWLSIPLFVLELWGVVQFCLLVSQAWGPPPNATPSTKSTSDVSIVVTATFHDPEQLERTLVGCASLRSVNELIVVVRSGRADLLAVCGRFGVDALTATGNHVDLFEEGCSASVSAIVGWLEAGQVPMPDFVDAMLGEFSDPGVATAQSSVGLMNEDSLAHLDGGRDEDAFRQHVVFPRMGAHGHGPWFGGGSLVRLVALKTTCGLDAHDQAALERSLVRMHAAGWVSRFHHHPELVRDTAPDDLDSYLVLRRRRAIEALRVFRTAENPLWLRGLPFRARLSHVASASSFGTGLRQLLLTGVLVVTLLSGVVPIGDDPVRWALWWFPGLLLTTAARRGLAGGSMHVGDWTRQGWRTLAADSSALKAIVGRKATAVGSHGHATGGVAALGSMRQATGLLLLLDFVLVARGATLFWPDLLPAFSRSERVLTLLLGLAVTWTLVDVLQVVVRRRQRRTQYRLSTELPAKLGNVAVTVVDLAPPGIGVIGPLDVPPGTSGPVQVWLPDVEGTPLAIEARATVRSVNDVGDGRYRLGLEFSDVGGDARSSLIRYCAIGHHLVNEGAAHGVVPADLEVARPDHHHRIVQLCTGIAVFLGAATLLVGPTAAPALAAVATPGSVCLSDSSGAPMPGAMASYYYGGWHQLGETGADGCVQGQMPETQTTVAIVANGVGNSKTHNFTTDPLAQFETVLTTVSLLDSVGSGLGGGTVKYYANGWRDFGVTDGSGLVSKELLESSMTFQVVHRGVVNEVRQDTGVDPLVEFKTVPVFSDAGATAVRYYSGRWRDFSSGMELLPAPMTFAMDDSSEARIALVAGMKNFVPSGAVTPLAPSPTPTPGITTQPTATPGVATQPTATPVPTVKDQPTATPVPTVKVQSTATPVPTVKDRQTATPVPTVKVQPTRTPVSTSTPEVPFKIDFDPTPVAKPTPSSPAGPSGGDDQAVPVTPRRALPTVSSADASPVGEPEGAPDDRRDDGSSENDGSETAQRQRGDDELPERRSEPGVAELAIPIPDGRRAAPRLSVRVPDDVYIELGPALVVETVVGEPDVIVYGVTIVNDSPSDTDDSLEFELDFEDPVEGVEADVAGWDCATTGATTLRCRGASDLVASGATASLELTVTMPDQSIPELEVQSSRLDLVLLGAVLASLGVVVTLVLRRPRGRVMEN